LSSNGWRLYNPEYSNYRHQGDWLRLDYKFSLAYIPAELRRQPQVSIQTYNTTAHQGLLKDQRLPPILVEVLGTVT
jgi:hypothetical protein